MNNPKQIQDKMLDLLLNNDISYEEYINYLNKRSSIKNGFSKILELDHNLPEKLLEKDLYSMGIDDHSESDCYD